MFRCISWGPTTTPDKKSQATRLRVRAAESDMKTTANHEVLQKPSRTAHAGR